MSFPLLPTIFQFVRAIRVVRLAKLAKILAPTALGLSATLGRRGVMYVTAVAGLAIVLGGALIVAVEPTAAGGEAIWDGIWWAAATTIGTGVAGPGPETVEGRLIAIVLLACGVAFVTTLAGSIAAFFLGHGRDARSDLDRQVADIHAAVVRGAGGGSERP